MNISHKKIQYFELVLSDFFQKVGREYLPWRKKKITAYEVWVSEIMLQQTQVSRVIGYYERFLFRYPTVEALAESDWKEFLPYYEGLGYYARGRNMLKAAKMITEEYNGKFPRDIETLRKLPGIGPYTASAILSFAYGKNHLAWDTNLKRVIGRFFFGSKKADLSVSFRPSLRVEESRRKKARSLDPLRRDFSEASKLGMTIGEYLESSFSLPAKTLNAGLMDFGSAICLSRPKCEACPLQKHCLYYKENGEQERIHNTKRIIQTTKADWKESLAFVFLHENHWKYFSAEQKTYVPFILAKGYNSRSGIKDWFQEKYGLMVSVRPPHKKLLFKGEPVLLVNAQILSGSQNFSIFSKKDYRAYTEDLSNNV